MIVEKSNTAVPLNLTIDGDGVGGITGLTPTVALRNARVSGSYLDFADGAFKTSGWTTKYANLTAVERGHYQRLVDFSVIAGIVSGAMLVAEFRVNESGIVGDDHELVLVVTSLEDIAADIDVVLSAAHGAGSWDAAGGSDMVVLGLGAPILERPASGTIAYRVLALFTVNGLLADPDSNTLTISASNQAGTSRSANLSATTMVRQSIGRYEVTYSVASAHEIEEIILQVSGLYVASAVGAFKATGVLDTTTASSEIVASGLNPNRS